MQKKYIYWLAIKIVILYPSAILTEATVIILLSFSPP